MVKFYREKMVRVPFPLFGDCYWLDNPCTRIILKLYLEKKPLRRKDFLDVFPHYPSRKKDNPTTTIRWLKVAEQAGLIQSYDTQEKGLGNQFSGVMYQLTGKGEILATSVIRILEFWNQAPLKVID